YVQVDAQKNAFSRNIGIIECLESWHGDYPSSEFASTPLWATAHLPHKGGDHIGIGVIAHRHIR
ncbi:hypothetical protein ACPTGH_14975, partial [Enterococcus faecalis]|uniref:hypothetical protein n=1 Tax=Enterococcus faecalis TaxID=1351 RepID=UPI003CC62915